MNYGCYDIQNKSFTCNFIYPGFTISRCSNLFYVIDRYYFHIESTFSGRRCFLQCKTIFEHRLNSVITMYVLRVGGISKQVDKLTG